MWKRDFFFRFRPQRINFGLESNRTNFLIPRCLSRWRRMLFRSCRKSLRLRRRTTSPTSRACTASTTAPRRWTSPPPYGWPRGSSRSTDSRRRTSPGTSPRSEYYFHWRVDDFYFGIIQGHWCENLTWKMKISWFLL